MNVVIYQSLIIHIIVLIYETYTREVHMTNISELLGADGIKLRCSYIIGSDERVSGVNFLATNESSDTFVDIADSTYFPENPTRLYPFGEYLFGTANITGLNELPLEVVLTFDNLKCKHERNYKCTVNIYNTHSISSTPIHIFVQVPPSYPEKVSVLRTPMIDSTTTETERPPTFKSSVNETNDSTITTPQQNDDIRTASMHSFSSTSVDNNITFTTLAYNITLGYNTTAITKTITESPIIMEGDNITCQCSGHVGKPAGIFIFKKHRQDNIQTTYNATTTEIVEIPGNCSYYRTSYFTFQVTAEDNLAVIRCSVVSLLADTTMFVESEPLKVQYKVRKPSVTKQPDKRDYIVGTDISITLTCRSDGNPLPMYHWFKEGSDENISTNETYTIMDINITYSGIYTCNVSNIINDQMQTETQKVKVNIINEHDEADISTSSSSTTGSSSHTEEKSGNPTQNITFVIIGVVCGVLFFVVLLIVGYCLHKRNKKSKDESPENNGSTNNLMHYNSKYMGGSRPDAYDSVNLEGDAPVVASGKKEQNVDDVRKHNEEYLKKQTNEEKNENKSTSPDQPVIYAEVNKANKSKYRQDAFNQQEEDTYAGTQEGIYDQSGNSRHKVNENAEQFDKIGDIKEQNSTDDAASLVKSNQKGSYVNQALNKGEKQVATVPPISRSSAGSQGYEQTSELSQKGYENVKGTDNTHTSTGQSINQTSF